MWNRKKEDRSAQGKAELDIDGLDLSELGKEIYALEDALDLENQTDPYKLKYLDDLPEPMEGE